MKRRRLRLAGQAGFSLVELMVATLLGLILTAGVISVYLASSKDYSLNNALGAVQNNGRLALNFLEPKIRMAGFFGCGHVVQPDSILSTNLATDSNALAVQGYEFSGTGMGATYQIKATHPGIETSASSWSPSLTDDIVETVGLNTTAPGGAIPGSDILLLHEAAPGGVNLVYPFTDDSDGLYVAASQDTQLAIGELALVTDCQHAGLFQITDIAKNYRGGNRDRLGHSSNATLSPGNNPQGRFAHNDYGADSQILSYGTYLFYVGIGRDKNPALYQVSLRKDATLGRPVELVSGIENMQLLFGVDTDADEIPNQFLTADQITDWDQVVSVRIALLTHSAESSTDAPGAPSFTLFGPTDGLTLTVPHDGRLRRVFEETISIRNRLP